VLLMRKFLVVAGVVSTLSACSPAPATSGVHGAAPAPISPAALKKVVLRVGDQKAGSRALLEASGELADVPYSIEWSSFTSGPPLLEAASAGAIDVGAVGNTPPIFAAAANSRISVVSAFKSGTEGDAILVQEDSPITDVASLKGKTVAVAKGSSAHGHLLLRLRQVGLAVTDVKIVYLAPADAYAAFSQHRVDAWAVWDPYTATAETKDGAHAIARGTGIANGLAFNVASRAALADPGRNSALRDYLTRLARARKWARSHTADWARAWASATGLPLPVVVIAVSRQNTVPIPLDQSVIDSEQALADAFFDSHVLPVRVHLSEFIDNRYDAALTGV
jgi:sulfonate transport system substrate-binding protein